MESSGDISPQFTLTCISTGGPATTVTWTRDSVNITEGTETVLVDPATAQYTHTLKIRTMGTYTCTVANNKKSSDSASRTVRGKIFYFSVFGVYSSMCGCVCICACALVYKDGGQNEKQCVCYCTYSLL